MRKVTDRDSRNRALITVGIVVVALAIVFGVVLPDRAENQGQLAETHAQIRDGIEQFRAEQYELSVQTLGSIPEERVDDWHVPYYLGSALVQLKDYENGAARLEQALALDPRNENVLFALGVAYFKLGNLGLSKAYFAKVIEINPNHEEARGLMDIMAKLERQSSAPTESE
jgi:tetratricopeptide (TPR) repeat protein